GVRGRTGLVLRGAGIEGLRARSRRLPQPRAAEISRIRLFRHLDRGHGRPHQRCPVGTKMTGRILRTLRRIAETITAAMVAALFFSVVYQVFTRYILEAPAGWTMEFASILWLWIIFFAGALLVPDEEQIRIDVLYLAVPLWLRKIFA